MHYELTNELEGTSEYLDLNPDTCNQDALSYIGYALLPINEIDFKENGDVQEYACVDKNDLSTVFTFFGQWQETACIEALTRLDYSLDEINASNIVEVNFTGIVA